MKKPQCNINEKIISHGNSLTEEEMFKAAEMAFHRSKVYKLFSYAFSYPDAELYEFIKGGEFSDEIKKAIQGRQGIRLPALLSLAERACNSLTLEELQDKYTRLFERPAEKSLLHEASYIDFPQDEMADIAGFYRAFGVTFDERPDHLGVELEFMYLITAKESKAALEGNLDNFDLCVDAEKKFLSAHTGRWVSSLTENITDRNSPTYQYLAEALKEWISMEASYLGIKLRPVSQPVQPETDDMICLAFKNTAEGGHHEV